MSRSLGIIFLWGFLVATMTSNLRSGEAKAGPDHWAWQPLAAGRKIVGHPVDFFVKARLMEKGLSHSPAADRRTLIRRLSFALHGLPPAPEAVAAFVGDSGPQAYEQLVDRMLAAPAFGERFARHWLDIAHYADTHGFERDKRRDHAWRYRDYVIRAFNEDRPYPRFLREQIAGDVFWPEDEQAIVATGFLAAGPWDFVGQAETKSSELRRAARALDLDDMATQVMTATVGLTVNCARCHDHKLDPISQEEYFRLLAAFAGVSREERVISGPGLERYEKQRKALIAERDRLDFEIGRIEGAGLDLADIVGGGNGLGTGVFRQGIDARTGQVQTRDFGILGNVKLNRFAKSAFDFVDGVFIPDGEDGKAAIPVSSTGLVVTGLPKTSGQAWDMIRNGPVASQHSPILGGVDFTKGGHTLLGLHANAGITFDLAAIREVTGAGAMRFTAALGYFGAEGAMRADARVYVDGVARAEFVGLRRADGIKSLDVRVPVNARFLTLISTDGGNGVGHDQIGFGDARLREDPARGISSGDRETLAGLRREKRGVESRIKALGPPPKFYGVVARKEMPETRVQMRGDPESEIGDPLAPGALALLPMLDSDLGDLTSTEGERRAALANWITHPANPLMPRVMVNRLWHWLFGKGLVDTPSDFGAGGGRPSHPALLDYLAVELRNRNGSLKSLLRLILTSETYRQDSRYLSGAAGAAVDAGNRLLWRQNPSRVEAEVLRDSVLFVSGKLNDARGGPGFEDFSYQDAYAPIYTYVTADEPALWRRSIYRYLVRTSPDPFLSTLDCPDPANLTPVRMTTTTPLQSLALYNNDFMLRQAGYFAERLRAAAGRDVMGQINEGYRLALSRRPDFGEAALARAFIRDESLFAFCRVLLNSNEFVYVD